MMRKILPSVCVIVFAVLVAASALAGSYIVNNKKDFAPSAKKAVQQAVRETGGIMSPRWPLTDCCVILGSADLANVRRISASATLSQSYTVSGDKYIVYGDEFMITGCMAIPLPVALLDHEPSKYELLMIRFLSHVIPSNVLSTLIGTLQLLKY